MLIKVGANVGAKDFGDLTPLCIAACENRSDMVDTVPRAVADRNILFQGENTPFFVAGMCGCGVLVDLLRAASAKVDSICSNGDRALKMAAESDRHTVIQSLLMASAKFTEC